MRGNNLVTKSNNLIETPLKLGVVEMRIIIVLISTLSPNDDDFKPYRFKISEFAKMIGVKNKNIHQQIKDYTYSLMSQPFYLHDNLQVTWLASAEYFPGEGVVEVEFSPKLKPYLLQLKEKFTTYRLIDIIKLKSAYAMRIYELLKQYERIGSRTFTVQRLKELLGIEDQYPVYADFKKRVLVKAQQEINKHTDISFSFEEMKTGRKITEIKFLLTSKSADAKSSVLNHPDKPAGARHHTSSRLRQQLKEEFGLQAKAIDQVLAQYDKNYIAENLEVVRSDAKRGRIKDIPAYTMSALKTDYRKKRSGLEEEQLATQQAKQIGIDLMEAYIQELSQQVQQHIISLSPQQLEQELEGLKYSVRTLGIEIVDDEILDPFSESGSYFIQYIQKKYFKDYTFELYCEQQTDLD
ncbi:replication initiation protein [Paenibacillus hunanensis]|uniref:replication initiation protein n=1 Tax=Paenibacillus hunanensis TaxID=539262 RepID=UPI0020274B3D|nr:replication initiation protein [Paenibacillus hunanensis]MCL9660264.1 replication initiation protein [Paenibacillus hunanensis]